MEDSQASTRARTLNWFVRGGTVRSADGRETAIDVDPVLVGRDPGAQLQLTDPEVSALHLELRAIAEGILVKDLGSTNGTFVGPVRVREIVVTGPTDVVLGQTRIHVEPSAKKRVDVGFTDRFGPLVGSSPKMRRVFSILEKVAPTPLS